VWGKTDRLQEVSEVIKIPPVPRRGENVKIKKAAEH
jgi:hypothetical protein